MKRTILSAAAICAIAVGFALPSTSFAATQMAHNDQPGWYETNPGNTGQNNNGESILGGALDFTRNCNGLLSGNAILLGRASCSQNAPDYNAPWTGDNYQYAPGK